MKDIDIIRIKYEAKMEGIKEGMKHSTSSPKTLKAIDKINESLQGLVETDQRQDIQYAETRKDVTYIKDRMEEGFMRIERAINKRDGTCSIHGEELEKKLNKKADKWVEKVVYALVGTTLLWVLNQFLDLI